MYLLKMQRSQDLVVAVRTSGNSGTPTSSNTNLDLMHRYPSSNIIHVCCCYIASYMALFILITYA